MKANCLYTREWIRGVELRGSAYQGLRGSTHYSLSRTLAPSFCPMFHVPLLLSCCRRQGSPATHVYVVASGEVRVLVQVNIPTRSGVAKSGSDRGGSNRTSGIAEGSADESVERVVEIAALAVGDYWGERELLLRQV